MTISLDQMNEDIRKIERDFYEVIHHPYVSRYLDKPDIDNDLIKILYYAMKKRGCSPKYINHAILACLLVDTALTVHDNVGLEDCIDERTRKERQLIVLTGDYYSSLYYYFLAKLGDISLMQVFSRSIQEINEIKMLPYEERENAADPFKGKKYLYRHTVLTANILKHLKLDKWAGPISGFFCLKNLLTDKKQLPDYTGECFITAILKEIYGKQGSESDTSMIYSEAIEDLRSGIEDGLPDWLPLRQFIRSRVRQLLEENFYQDFVAEEG
ncbi:heptaprenyl diphosphate synthase component 1 [Alteribacter natronophilus]|uniref:heptaprenyl diphosphate synthase component 1 n=1 Tax=Alteribacter natronophilus TaxID=2583810 RepID=UPI00110F37F6|nr:heptaprenyl diphosphate synthase component 1 [Alteribacter natronophilus]TMW73603.1 hypothetical protein FGB90_04705 [Alteribacter natronophilus]